MPVFEKQEKVEAAVSALKEWQQAKKRVATAQSTADEKLKALKDMTGITSNDANRIEEELLIMIGRAQVAGLLEG